MKRMSVVFPYVVEFENMQSRKVGVRVKCQSNQHLNTRFKLWHLTLTPIRKTWVLMQRPTISLSIGNTAVKQIFSGRLWFSEKGVYACCPLNKDFS